MNCRLKPYNTKILVETNDMNKLKSIDSPFWILLAVLMLVGCNGINVSPDFSKGFIKYFGGSSNQIPSEVQIALDGGYIIIGTTYSSSKGASDIYVVKTDASGNEIWEKKFGGDFADEGSSIKVVSDGGYIISGTFGLDDSGQNAAYMVKIDGQGNVNWETKLGTKGSGAEVQVAKNGGYYMIANDNSGAFDKIFLYKADADGNKIFQSEGYGYTDQNTLGTSILEESPDTLFTWVGSFVSSPILAGNRPTGNFFAYLKGQDPIKELSLQTYSQIKKTNDNGYIVTGSSIKNGVYDAFLIKFGADLKNTPSKSWFNSYGGNMDDESNSVSLTQDGGYVFCGYTKSNGNGGKDVYLVKVDGNGNKQWEKTFGGPSDDEGVSVQQTSDGGFIVVASFSLITTPSDNKVICLIKTDANGEITN